LDDASNTPILGGRITPQQDFGTLGDIMSNSTTGLVTMDGGNLQDTYNITSPLDRMALTANGNLQRLVSSYYDAPVHVTVQTCSQTCHNTWNRVVSLSVLNQEFCTATSHITVYSEECLQLIHSHKVGLGQLFRHLDRLPSFELHQAGYNTTTGELWRVYELNCEELTCHIQETFVHNMWNITRL
jgi:hypothetical protein